MFFYFYYSVFSHKAVLQSFFLMSYNAVDESIVSKWHSFSTDSNFEKKRKFHREPDPESREAGLN